MFTPSSLYIFPVRINYDIINFVVILTALHSVISGFRRAVAENLALLG
jgi:hypothetical protein